MAQPAVSGGRGKNPLGITGFWPSKCTEPPMMWEFWINRFQWGWWRSIPSIRKSTITQRPLLQPKLPLCPRKLMEKSTGIRTNTDFKLLLPKDVRRTGDGIQEGKERDI